MEDILDQNVKRANLLIRKIQNRGENQIRVFTYDFFLFYSQLCFKLVTSNQPNGKRSNSD